MLEKISKKITAFFIKKGVVEAEQSDVYDYCFEIMLSTLINLAALIIIGVATQRYIETAIFGTLFMLLRGTAGGHHASTHFGCFFSLMIVYAAMQLMMLIPIDILKWISLALMSIAVLIYLLLAPVDCSNKRLEKEHRRKLKLKLLIILSCAIIAFAVLFCFPVTVMFAFNVSFTAFSVAMLVTIGTIKNVFEARKVASLAPISETVDDDTTAE